MNIKNYLFKINFDKKRTRLGVIIGDIESKSIAGNSTPLFLSSS